MEKQELTIHDEMQLEGALVIMRRFSEHLTVNARKVIENYDAEDFDEDSFLADVAYAIDNADVVEKATQTVKKILAKMREEIVPVFNKEEQ